MHLSSSVYLVAGQVGFGLLRNIVDMVEYIVDAQEVCRAGQAYVRRVPNCIPNRVTDVNEVLCIRGNVKARHTENGQMKYSVGGKFSVKNVINKLSY
ncbi:hypothetical protein MAR_002551 [Mya arenaria]|uniref:Uncharacterized protein n=1 Tax=Mya arenaria TaxID=6604 RepID=A0ABY7G3F3_MYAAR|nr:hypothetical protein MAR_002551 [Mya arenaria]